MVPRPPLAAAFLVAVLLSACSLARDPGITAADLQREIAAGQAPIIVDVRSDGEFAAGHVPGAVHLAFLDVSERYQELHAGPDDRIVVYCAHGPRAALARRALIAAGFRNVLYLQGHMTGWVAAGLPVEN